MPNIAKINIAIFLYLNGMHYKVSVHLYFLRRIVTIFTAHYAWFFLFGHAYVDYVSPKKVSVPKQCLGDIFESACFDAFSKVQTWKPVLYSITKIWIHLLLKRNHHGSLHNTVKMVIVEVNVFGLSLLCFVLFRLCIAQKAFFVKKRLHKDLHLDPSYLTPGI